MSLHNYTIWENHTCIRQRQTCSYINLKCQRQKWLQLLRLEVINHLQGCSKRGKNTGSCSDYTFSWTRVQHTPGIFQISRFTCPYNDNQESVKQSQFPLQVHMKGVALAVSNQSQWFISVLSADFTQEDKIMLPATVTEATHHCVWEGKHCRVM